MKSFYNKAKIKEFFTEERKQKILVLLKWIIVGFYPYMWLSHGLWDADYPREFVVIYLYGVLSIAFIYGLLKKDPVLIILPILSWSSIVIVYIISLTRFIYRLNNEFLFSVLNRMELFVLEQTQTTTFARMGLWWNLEPWFIFFSNLIVFAICKIIKLIYDKLKKFIEALKSKKKRKKGD